MLSLIVLQDSCVVFIVACSCLSLSRAHTGGIAALNLNIRGKDIVELWVKGWRCGRSSGVDGR